MVNSGATTVTRFGVFGPTATEQLLCECNTAIVPSRGTGEGRGREYMEACEAYCLAAAIIFRSMTFLAASIAGSSVSRRVLVPFSLRNCWMNESS